MDHTQEVQWFESHYLRQLEHHNTTVKALKEDLIFQSQLVKEGMVSPLSPRYLALQAVMRKIEPERQMHGSWLSRLFGGKE